MDRNCHIFVGPTASGIPSSEFAGWVRHPPVARFDLPTLIADNDTPGLITIVDGYFYAVPAVGHVEIMDALDSGWEVHGLSSMGAIRAADLYLYGMQGFGRVYGELMSGAGASDDLVIELHGPAPDYVAYSEPAIHLELALEEFYAAELLDKQTFRSLRESLRSTWYANRTWTLLKESLRGVGVDSRQIDERLDNVDRFRQKTKDLVEYLGRSGW